MLRTTRNMKDKYEKIQNYLFNLIPEKWDEIYLYASVVNNKSRVNTGELYFYYIPKGILKRRPINVYEVPQRFNINEEQYMKIVEELYNCIKDLKQDFIDTDQKKWNSITISIANSRFRVEFNYNPLPATEKENEERHVVWRYRYLKIGGDNKKEQKILDSYYSNRKGIKSEIYETGIYLKTENSEVTFDRESGRKEKVVYEKDDKNDNEKDNEKQVEEVRKSKVKNQILNM